MAGERPGEMRIGEILREARERAGLDLAAVEQQTKIRGKYLRALEDEQWATLPSEAYAKGFLRTYAQLLGLDADALVDELRRQVESGRSRGGYPLGEQVLERRRAVEGPSGPRPGLLLAGFVATLVAALVLVGLLTGDEDGSERDRRPTRQEARQERRQAEQRRERRRERRQEQRAAAEKVSVELDIRAPVAVCLLAGDQQLIDGQVLAAGSHEGPWRAKRFSLRFPSGYDVGQFRLLIDGDRERVPETTGPTAYEIVAPGRVRPASTPGPTCP